MSLLTFKFFAALGIFLTTVIGGLAPIVARFRPFQSKSFWFGESFASGVFLGAALFHLLPDADKGFTSIGYTYPYAQLLCLAAFFTLFFLEKIVLHLAKLRVFYSPNLIPYLLVFILCAHAFIDGSVVGINSTLGAALIVFVAVVAHKGSESFSLATRLNCSQLSTQRIITLFALFALITPIGIAVGTWAESLLQSQTGTLSAAVFNGIAAGTFLYTALFHTHEGAPHAHSSSNAKRKQVSEFVALLTGALLMGLISILV